MEQLCAKAYLADFVIRSPKYRKGGRHEREAADLLLPWPDRMLALQIKTRRVDRVESAFEEVEQERFAKRIDEAVRQIRTLREALGSGQLVCAPNLKGVSIPIPRDFDRCVGIVIASVVGPNGEVLDGASQSSCRVDRVGAVSVHSFLASDFVRVVDEFDTVPDLLKYLDLRERLVFGRRLANKPDECDLLAACLMDAPSLEQALAVEGRGVWIAPGLWAKFHAEHSEAIDRRDSAKLASRIFDDVIEQAFLSIKFDPVVEIGDLAQDPDGWAWKSASSDEAFAIASYMAQFSRAERMEFAKKMAQKARMAGRSKLGQSYFSGGRPGGPMLLFLASVHPRAKRVEQLYELSKAACAHAGASKVLGIVTEGAESTRRSFDFVMVAIDDEEERRAFIDIGKRRFKPVVEETTDEWKSSEG